MTDEESERLRAFAESRLLPPVLDGPCLRHYMGHDGRPLCGGELLGPFAYDAPEERCPDCLAIIRGRSN